MIGWYRALLLTSFCFISACSREPVAKPAEERPQPRSGAIRIDPAVSKDLGITVATVEELPLSLPVTATGHLQLNEDASWLVGAITEGKVISVPVRVGDSVREGQTLAELHSHDVHDARATYRQAVAQLAREKAIAEQAKTVRDRTRRLFDLKAASREQLDAAETAYSTASNTVAAMKAEVDKAQFHLTDFLEVPVESSDHHEGGIRDGLRIRAPASGTVMERRATVGTVVSAGDLVFTIADLRSLWLIASVNEADMSRIRTGQSVEIEVRAFPGRKFAGKVLRLGERLDPQTRTLQVRVLVPNADGLLKPDMFAAVSFLNGETRSAIQVPELAVSEINGKQFVFLAGGQEEFTPIEVRIGNKMGDRIQIVSGIRAGDRIVVGGAHLLRAQLIRKTSQ